MSAPYHRGHPAKTGSTAGNALEEYLRDISAYDLLTVEQESELARRIREGDRDAVDALVCANLRFVVSIAKRYQHGALPLLDLIAEGNFGLVRAAERFDERRGVRFISYAVWWIRQAMVQALAEQSRVVRVPINFGAGLRKLGRRADALSQELGREPTQAELAEAVNADESEVARALVLLRSSVSFDAPVGNERDSLTLADMLRDEHAAAPDDDVLEASQLEVLRDALDKLRPRERQILTLNFGLDGSEPMSLEAIGSILGITRERVRQLKEKALWRLRTGDHGSQLAACGQ